MSGDLIGHHDGLRARCDLGDFGQVQVNNRPPGPSISMVAQIVITTGKSVPDPWAGPDARPRAGQCVVPNRHQILESI